MEKWLLLAISVVAVYGAVESVRWLRLMQKSSTENVERVAGYDGSQMPGLARERAANHARFGAWGLPAVAFIMVGIAIGMLIVTVRAFLGDAAL
jgi:hypothetical protein